jgi:hypothetical protein
METTTHLTPMPQHSAETQPLRRLAVFLSLAALLLLLAGGAFVGTKITAPHQATASHSCHTIRAILHGGASPSFSCLDGQKLRVHVRAVAGSSPLAAPSVFEQDACYDDDLVLHWDSNLNGYKLCVNGSGVLNLTDVWNYNLHVSWNDEVSSFWTGCYSDYFYTDINRGGSVAWAPGSPGGFYSGWNNFPLGGVGNDTLSSIWQYYSYGGPHCGS